MNKRLKFYSEEKDKICKCCGKRISTFMRNMSEYVYKLPKKKCPNTFDYYCSYTCFRKAEKIREEQNSREEKAALLNKYNGVLTLEEAELVENVNTFLGPEDAYIKTRKDYLDFIYKHRHLIDKLKSKGYLD